MVPDNSGLGRRRFFPKDFPKDQFPVRRPIREPVVLVRNGDALTVAVYVFCYATFGACVVHSPTPRHTSGPSTANALKFAVRLLQFGPPRFHRRYHIRKVGEIARALRECPLLPQDHLKSLLRHANTKVLLWLCPRKYIMAVYPTPIRYVIPSRPGCLQHSPWRRRRLTRKFIYREFPSLPPSPGRESADGANATE